MIGHIVNIDALESLMMVRFPFGQIQLSMDHRELAHFGVGEDVLFDRQLRPIWSARPGAS